MAPSPARRKSIAVPHHSKPPRPSHKRRPHSITPGDSVLKQLSPASRARRSLGPRKSILKPRPDEPDEPTQSQSIDDTRKSFGRRVSFAPNAHVRIFEKDNNTNNSQSPASSPAGPSEPPPQQQPRFNDENDYPGAKPSARRRSSLRRSIAFSENGEASMDLDDDFDEASSPLPAGFLLDQSDIQDEDFDEDGPFDDDDMDMTQALTNNIRRKSRSSVGSRRSSMAPIPPYPSLDESDPPLEEHHSRSVDMSETSMDMTRSSEGDDNTAPMEFTVPLSKSLREPEPPSAEWLALRAITHSGNSPPSPPSPGSDDDEDMAIIEAERRLQSMRLSLGLDGAVPEPHDDSFTSSEGSSFGADDNQTMNMTNVLRRQSIATSEGSSSMDLTRIPPSSEEEEIVHNPLPSPPVVVQPESPTPARSPARAPSEPPLTKSLPQYPTVFSKPGSVFNAPEKPSAPGSSVNNKPAPPPSPSRATSAPPASPRRGGTAAFAPPVPRPQPKRAADGEHEDVPSPAKRPALGNKVFSASTSTASSIPVPQQQLKKRSADENAHTSSPPKRPALESNAPAPAPNAGRRVSVAGTGLRRPSGTFAQRKSLGPSGRPNLPQSSSSAKPGRTNAVVEDVEREDVVERENARPAEEPPHLKAAQDAVDISSPGPQVVTDVDLEQPWQPPERADATEQWRTGIEAQAYSDEDDEPPISIEQFFAMTGIRFMDELAAPRRSTIHPSQLARRSSISADEVSLAEYFIACAVDVPQLELYGHVARDLTGWIEHAKEVYNQAEEEAAKCTPALFREYSAADEEVKEELLHQLKLIKVNNNGAARSQWYDWRLQWVEQLYATADQGFIELTEDAKALEGIIGETQGLMPSLREEHARVMEELAAEQAIAADIENSDQDYLSELKNTIAEQGVALDAFRTDVGETNAKLERLEEKLAEIEAQKAEAASAIADSRRLIHIQKNSTSAEVFRLKDELAALEALHLWHTAKIQPDLFEFVYASRFHVSVPCVKFRPIVSDIRIARTADMPLKFKDAFPRLTELTVRLAQQRVRAAPADTSVRRVVQALGGLWSGYHQLRTQFAFLAIRYPLTVDALPPAKDGTVTGAIASADVLLPSAKAKVVVSFILDADTMSRWPMSIGGVRCQVKKAYGRDVDVEKIRAAVQEFVAQTNPDDNHACFLDACVDATYEYQPQ